MYENIDKNLYTPMMRQYLTIKEDYPDSLVFFRLGDFYEMFFNDAIVASRELEIVLTDVDLKFIFQSYSFSKYEFKEVYYLDNDPVSSMMLIPSTEKVLNKFIVPYGRR